MKWTPEKRAEQIAIKRSICKEIDEAGRPYHPTIKVIAARLDQPGLSAKNIRTFFDRWLSEEKDDRALDPYHGLFENKSRILIQHGLSPELIRKWLKLKNTSLTEWAAARGFTTNTASLAVNGKRVGPKSQAIMDRLAAEIQGSPIALLEEAAEIRSKISQLQEKEAIILERIRAATKDGT